MLIADESRKEALFLRGNELIELYCVSDEKFSFIAKYHLLNGKCFEIAKIRLTWKTKDVIVLYMPKDKVISCPSKIVVGCS